MSPVTFFPRAETLEFDEDVLTRLCARHGEDAEHQLAELLREVEDGLALVSVQLRLKSRSGLLRTATDLVVMARTIGLLTLERAAIAVLRSAELGDDVAFAACTNRLAALWQPDTFGQWKLHGGSVA
jgi:hypothetical protein